MTVPRDFGGRDASDVADQRHFFVFSDGYVFGRQVVDDFSRNWKNKCMIISNKTSLFCALYSSDFFSDLWLVFFSEEKEKNILEGSTAT